MFFYQQYNAVKPILIHNRHKKIFVFRKKFIAVAFRIGYFYSWDFPAILHTFQSQLCSSFFNMYELLQDSPPACMPAIAAKSGLCPPPRPNLSISKSLQRISHGNLTDRQLISSLLYFE